MPPPSSSADGLSGFCRIPPIHPGFMRAALSFLRVDDGLCSIRGHFDEVVKYSTDNLMSMSNVIPCFVL